MTTHLRALLVEDDQGDAVLTRDLIASQPGDVRIELERVDRLSAALECLPGLDVDVVLLDLGLPDSQGLQTFVTLHEQAPTLPTVVLTGADDDELALAAIEAGAQDYLVKGQLMHLPVARLIRYAVERHRLQSAALEHERNAAEKLRALDEMKNTFLQAVSHELRTPLTVIRGFALTLHQLGERLSVEQRSTMVDRLNSASERLERLLADLLDVDRLSRGLMAANRRPTDVAALLTGVAAQVDLQGRVLSVDCPSNLVVQLDPGQVERIVENLLRNAAKHTPTGTRIQLSVVGDGQGIVLSVADDGPGIDEEVARRIFEPFVQGPKSGSDASPGTGIGLALVARLAELHGGAARVEHAPGGGARFVVELPSASPQDTSRTPPASPLPSHAGHGRRELLHHATVTASNERPPASFEGKTALRDVLDRVGHGDALLHVRFEPTDELADSWVVAEPAAAIVRSATRAIDQTFLLDPLRFVVVLPEADGPAAAAIRHRIATAANEGLPDVRLTACAAEVADDESLSVLRRVCRCPGNEACCN